MTNLWCHFPTLSAWTNQRKLYLPLISTTKSTLFTHPAEFTGFVHNWCVIVLFGSFSLLPGLLWLSASTTTLLLQATIFFFSFSQLHSRQWNWEGWGRQKAGDREVPSDLLHYVWGIPPAGGEWEWKPRSFCDLCTWWFVCVKLQIWSQMNRSSKTVTYGISKIIP